MNGWGHVEMGLRRPRGLVLALLLAAVVALSALGWIAFGTMLVAVPWGFVFGYEYGRWSA